MKNSAARIFSPDFNFKHTARTVLFVTLLLVSFGCTALERIPLSLGNTAIDVEVADSPETRAKGLMGRKSLPDNQGMLFVFSRDQRLSFWMKNTEIPLSVAYISSDGTIREIHDLEPHNEIPVTSMRSLRYALEMNQGAFSAAGVSPGDKVGGLPLK